MHTQHRSKQEPKYFNKVDISSAIGSSAGLSPQDLGQILPSEQAGRDPLHVSPDIFSSTFI